MSTEDKSDDTVAAEKQDGESGPALPAQPHRHPAATAVLATGVTALVAAIVCTGYFAYTAVNAYFFESPVVELRDDSVDAAEQAILNVTSVDPKDTKGWQKRVESTLTGNARKQINDQVIAQLQQQVTQSGQQGASVTSQITRAAATSLDEDADTAKVLVFARVKSKSSGTVEAREAPMNFLVTVVNVDGSRKVSEIVPLTGIPYQEGGN